MHLKKLLFASAVLVAMSGSARAESRPGRIEDVPPEITNCWIDPVGNPTGFELDYQGNVTTTIPSQVTTDYVVNPWYGQHLATPASNYNPTTVAFDMGANLTRVILSGDPLPNPRTLPPMGNPNSAHNMTSYHTGTNVGWGVVSAVTLVSREWLYPTSSLQVQSPQVSWNGVFNGKPKKLFWAVIYVGTGEGTAGCWSAAAYQPSRTGAAAFVVANNTAAAITIDAIGYQLGIEGPQGAKCRQSPQCPANQKALDMLNDEFYPIPGVDGSQFITVKGPKKPLQPGQSFVFKAK
jgi:hypothetical protein